MREGTKFYKRTYTMTKHNITRLLRIWVKILKTTILRFYGQLETYRSQKEFRFETETCKPK